MEVFTYCAVLERIEKCSVVLGYESFGCSLVVVAVRYAQATGSYSG